MIKKFYHAGWGDGEPFSLAFPKAKHESVNSPKEMINKNACLVLWGGEDISPAIYHRENLGQSPKMITRRDATEIALTKRATELDIPIFGVCRGAQLLCALAGGILVQDVRGHVGSQHMVTFMDGFEAPMTTVHHQMMYPWDIEHELLAWTPNRSEKYRGITEEERAKVHVDPELVWFPRIKGLGVQGHPEMMHPQSRGVIKTMQILCDKVGHTYGT